MKNQEDPRALCAAEKLAYENGWIGHDGFPNAGITESFLAGAAWARDALAPASPGEE